MLSAALLLAAPVALASSTAPAASTAGVEPVAATFSTSRAAPVAPGLQPLYAEITNQDFALEGAKEHEPRTTKRKAVIRATAEERVQAISANTSYDVPAAALEAYQHAASYVASADPGCGLSWGLVAAIGQVESSHGRFGGSAVLADGTVVPSIVGLPLNGVGPVAMIRDTDGGRLDGDKVWDRAVGPMQFIPSTWAGIGVDGDGNGVRDPNDFDDAALATALYLCSGTVDMRVLSSARAAIMRYNNSEEYVDLVLEIANAYDSGIVDVVPNDAAPPPREGRHHDRDRRDRDGDRQRQRGDRDRDGGSRDGDTRQRDGDGTRQRDGDGSGGGGTGGGGTGGGSGDGSGSGDGGGTGGGGTGGGGTGGGGTGGGGTGGGDPAPDPEPELLSGPVVVTGADKWAVGGTALSFGSGVSLALAYGDFDGDQVNEALAEELNSLAEQATAVTVELDSYGKVALFQNVELVGGVEPQQAGTATTTPTITGATVTTGAPTATVTPETTTTTP